MDDFGRARFGDIIVKPDRRRLSLLRLTLDSEWKANPGQGNGGKHRAVQTASVTLASTHEGDGGGGSVTSGDNGSNGVPIWP